MVGYVAQSGVHSLTHPIVVDYAGKRVPLPTPVSLLDRYCSSLGLYPPVSHVSDGSCNYAQSALLSCSAHKPEMGISLIPVPELDTGGERWVSNPR